MHLIQEVTDGLEVFDVCTVGVESAFAGGTGGERLDDELLSTTRVNLEREL